MRIVKVVVASPGDVDPERDSVQSAVGEVNAILQDAHVDMLLRVVRWEIDVLPGFDAGGPQARVDAYLGIADADIVIGIFWKRFGTAMPNGEFCTEHEIRTAYQAWKNSGKPQIIVYFSQRSYTPTVGDIEQVAHVLKFKDELYKLGVVVNYSGTDEFERRVREHLRKHAFEIAFQEGRREVPISNAPPIIIQRAVVGAFTCSISSSICDVCAEGLTERVSDLRLTFSGPSPLTPEGEPPRLGLEIYFNTQITNRTDENGLGDVLLWDDNSSTPRRGRVMQNRISFDNIAAYSTSLNDLSIMSITNIRVNASIPASGKPAIPGQIIALVQITPGSVIVANPVQVLGLAQDSL